jgi:cation:H+ antiporter
MNFILIILLLFLSFILIKAADQIVIAVHRLSKNSSSVAFIISALFLALATSLPELFVAITSGLDEVPSLSVGNVIGANIANLGLVVGLATFFAGKIVMHQRFVKKEITIAFIAGLLPLFLLIIDGELDRVDGLIMIIAYLAYALSFFRQKFAQISEEVKESHFNYKTFTILSYIDSKKSKEIARFFIGIILMLFASNYIVEIATQLAVSFNIPLFLVGLVLVSIGTTLPELAFSIRSIKDGQPTMFLGNILGSIITNSTLVIGVAVFLSPLTQVVVSKYLIAGGTFILTYGLFWYFIRSKLTLEKWEGFVLLLIYAIFVFIEFM